MFQRLLSLGLILEDKTSLEMEINWPRKGDDTWSVKRTGVRFLWYVDAKIMSKAEAIKIKNVPPNIIHHNQSGFI